jgi:hypothetical protein
MSLAPPQPVLEEGGGDGREQHGQQQGAGQGQAELRWHEWTFEADIPRLGRGELLESVSGQAARGHLTRRLD